jgi:hypothetical protein
LPTGSCLLIRTHINCVFYAPSLWGLLNMSQSSADNQVPRQGIKFVPGQELTPGCGNLTAVFEHLKSRDLEVLVEGVRKDIPPPGRTPASMQVWPRVPGRTTSPQVLISPMMTTFLCIRALQRAGRHSVWLTPLGSPCSACVHFLFAQLRLGFYCIPIGFICYNEIC